MGISITAAGTGSWNSNLMTVVPQTGDDCKILVCIHKDSEGPLEGATIHMTAEEFINVARALGIIVGQKLPPKPDTPK